MTDQAAGGFAQFWDKKGHRVMGVLVSNGQWLASRAKPKIQSKFISDSTITNSATSH